MASPVFHTDLSEAEIAHSLNRSGFVCLEKSICPDWLASAQRDVRSLLSTGGRSDFSVVDGAHHGSSANRLAGDGHVQPLLRGLWRLRARAERISAPASARS